jgi:hypothetical protein
MMKRIKCLSLPRDYGSNQEMDVLLRTHSYQLSAERGRADRGLTRTHWTRGQPS